jgi:hypothetical protein
MRAEERINSKREIDEHMRISKESILPNSMSQQPPKVVRAKKKLL